MIDWRTLKIGDLGRVVTGRTPPSEISGLFGDGVPFITPTDITDSNRFVRTDRRLSLEGEAHLGRIVLPERAVCFVCIGATIGKMCMTDRPSVTNQQVNSIIVDRQRHCPEFVYYLLRSQVDDIKGRAGGAATPIINKTAFSDVDVLAPPLPIQRRIASILGAYDDLIEVNRRRIAVLEEMARGLFDEWFIHFRFPGHEGHEMVETERGRLPRGWQCTSLGDMAVNHDRHRRPLSQMQRALMKGDYPYYGAAKVFDYIDQYIFDGNYLLVAEDGSVITSDGHPVLQLARGRFWVNNHAHVLQGRAPVSTEYLFLALERYPIQGHITGAAQPKITQGNLNRIPVSVGPSDLMKKFQNLVSPLFGLRGQLEAANQRLVASRDVLLPRMISGDLPVAAAEAERETAA